MQINIKPQRDDDGTVAEKREKKKRNIYKYNMNNQLCMSNIERKNREVDCLLTSCISKNNNVNKAEEESILISSQLFSLFLSHSITTGNAETTSRCPHCRPLTIFFSSTLLYIY